MLCKFIAYNYNYPQLQSDSNPEAWFTGRQTLLAKFFVHNFLEAFFILGAEGGACLIAYSFPISTGHAYCCKQYREKYDGKQADCMYNLLMI